MKRQTVNQATACVRTAHTLRVGFEVPCNSQVGYVAQPYTRSVGYAGYGLLAENEVSAKLKRSFNEVEKQPAHWFVLGGRAVWELMNRPYLYLRPSEKW